MVNLLSCNVNGLRDTDRLNHFVGHFSFPSGSIPRPHILALQETHSTLEKVVGWATRMYSDVLFSHGTTASVGVLLAFRPSLSYKIISYNSDSEGQYIVANVEINGEPVTIVNAYCRPQLQSAQLAELFDKIGGLVEATGNEKVIWADDFNAILDRKMDGNKQVVVNSSRDVKCHVFNELLNAFELTDIWRVSHPDQCRYTFFRAGSLSRLDYLLGSPSMMTNILSADIGTAYGSDHSPLHLSFTFDENIRGKGFWRMPEYLIKDSEFKQRVIDEIQLLEQCNSEANPGLLWDTIKSGIWGVAIKYASELKRSKKKRIERVEAQIADSVLERDSSITPQEMQRYDDKVKYLQSELDIIFTEVNEKSFSFKKAQKYFRSEKCNKYFLRSRQSFHDSIKKLKSKDGKILESDSDILHECHTFYSDLYRKSAHPDSLHPVLLHKFLKNVPGDKISLQNHILLSKDITEQELHTSLKLMKLGTSPGEDGLTVEFMLDFWPVIGKFVHNSIQEAWNSQKMSISQRRGLLRLIPKAGKDPIWVQNWRPITVLNVDYKIHTKALAEHLAQVLPHLIHQDQKGFVKNRNPGGNVLDVYAMIQEASKNEEEYLLMLVDIEKAFDSVSWHFLEEVLHAYNFPIEFITWVKILQRDMEIRIMNNGHASVPIFPTMGTAQGSSLSPLLFVLVIETLALSIHSNKLIQGFSAGNFNKKIAMLADDTLLALKGNKVSFEAALITLQEFAIISNLKVNTNKSEYISLSLTEKTIQELQEVLQVEWRSKGVFRYIGVDIQISPEGVFQDNITSVLPAVQRVLAEKNTSSHSLLGRVLVVKSLIASRFLYPLQYTQSPTQQLIKHIQRACNKYMWSYGIHHIKAPVTYQSVAQGGLGMYSFDQQNDALKLKWIV